MFIFAENLACFVFFETTVLRFALLPYYRRYLSHLGQWFLKQPTMVVSDSIENHKQPILTIYRLAHGCSFKVLKNLFAVSQSVATETLNQVIRVMVSYRYNKFVYFPRSGKEWRTECKIFIKNYEFPYIGV